MNAYRNRGRGLRFFALASLALAVFFTFPAAPFAEVDENNFEGLDYRLVGPFRGGRVTAVAGHAADPLTFYMGATGGGVWVTHNAGQTWDNISDGQIGVGSIGAIAVAPSDSNVIYMGTGSAGIRGVSASAGDGLYRSTDGGQTWTHIGLSASRQIAAIVVHPTNSDLLYVAVQGSSWAPTEERGVYRSSDGGETWERVLFVNDTAGASDVVIDVNNPRVLYASMWDHKREPWFIRSGGEGSGVHKSTDGGTTWEKLGGGLPETIGKSGVAVSPANPDRVWAIVEAEGKTGGLYRSDDAGESFSLINDDRRLHSRSWYYMHVFADPANENTVYIMHSGAFKSIDGGKTVSGFAQAVHGDHHALWVNPENTDIIINGNDGGATVTVDGGATWSTQYNQPTIQFYRVNSDNQYPYVIYGGQQDNSTVAVNSRGRDGGIGIEDFHDVGGCESGHVAFDPDNPRYIYAGCYLGIINEFDSETGTYRSIDLDPTFGFGVSPRDRKFRFNWNAPILVSKHDPSVIYFGGNILFRSDDRAQNWEAISPDLTRNEDEKQGAMGGPITNEITENYNTLLAVAESPHDANVIWAGSDDGLIHITRDGGITWENITPRRLGEAMINSIEASPHNPGTAYVAVTKFKHNDWTPYIYKTTDYGQRWTNIAGDIKDTAFVRVVREDPVREGLLFAGTELGVFVSFDDGEDWQSFQKNLPVVPITDLMVNGADLVLATQGRSFWVLDDFSPLREIGEIEGVFQLYAPEVATFLNTISNVAPDNVPNPDNGARIDFYLPDAEAAGQLTLEILDSDGNRVRAFRSKGEEEADDDEDYGDLKVATGLNRFSWDFSTEPLEALPGFFSYAFFIGTPNVVPGNYTIKLSNADDAQEQMLVIRDDPTAPDSSAGRVEIAAITNDMLDKINELHTSIADLKIVKGQVEAKMGLKDDVDLPEELTEAGKTVNDNINNWIETLISQDRKFFQDALNWQDQYLDEMHITFAYIWSAIPPLTRSHVEKYDELVAKWPEVIGERDRIIAEDVGNFNSLYNDLDLPAILVPGEVTEEEEAVEEVLEESNEEENTEETEESEDY